MAATFIPLWYLVVRSTERGWDPWARAFGNSAVPLMTRSLGLALAVSLICVAVALPAAWLTTRANLPGRGAWAVLLAAPLAIPSYIYAMAVVTALGPKGLLQGWLEPFGVDRLPEIYGFWGATLTLSAVSFPYLYLVLRAAFVAMDPSEEEASRSLGIGPWRTFLRVVLPPLAPAIAAGLLLVSLYTLSDFGAVSTLNYETFTRSIFIEYQSSFDRTGAAVLAVMLAAVSSVILVGELVTRAGKAGRNRARRQGPASPIELGRWRWPAVAFLAAIVFIALGMPIGVLAYWLGNGLQAGTEFPAVWEPLRNSVTLGLAGAAVTVALALPVAILAARFGGVVPMLIEQAAYLTHALPGLVVALALVFFGIGYARDLYQTTWMLLLAYVILFLPNALSALRASLVRQSPRLEDAGAALGRSPLRVLGTVTLPLARPGAMAALALVFLTIMKELPATLLLAPPGFETLPALVWGRSTSALYAGAALPALLLIAVSAIPVAFLVWRGDIGTIES